MNRCSMRVEQVFDHNVFAFDKLSQRIFLSGLVASGVDHHAIAGFVKNHVCVLFKRIESKCFDLDHNEWQK